METQQKPITIYTEANPNPNSLKFVADFMLAPEGSSFDYPDVSSAADAPLALALFQFPFVRRVFFASNFVTITKDENTSWEDIAPSLKDFIKSYLEAGKPIPRSSPPLTPGPPESEKRGIGETERRKTKQFTDSVRNSGGGAPDSEIVKKIKNVLEQYVRPAVEMDGGNISFDSFQDGVVKVNLQGACSGCPSSAITLKQGIENLFKQMVPEVKEVVAEGV